MDKSKKKSLKAIRNISFLSFGRSSNDDKSREIAVSDSQLDSDKNEVKLDDEMDKVFSSYEFPEILPKTSDSRLNSYLSKQNTAPDCLISIPNDESPVIVTLNDNLDNLIPDTNVKCHNLGPLYDEKRVKFTVGEAASNKPLYQKYHNNRFYRAHHYNNRQYYYCNRQRKLSLQDERKSSFPGNVILENLKSEIDGEDADLHESDIDDIASHRFGHQKPSRPHHRFSSPYLSISRKDVNGLENVLSVYKKIYDHSPHEVFVQLDELSGTGEELEWRETARWIKYEEDYETGAERWGKPHVASLSFHSLLNLRRCLETGVVLLDLEEKDLPGIAYRVTEQMVHDELIAERDKIIVLKSLLLKHRHADEHNHDRSFLFNSKRPSSYTSLLNIHEAERKRNTQYYLNTLRKNGSMLESPSMLTCDGNKVKDSTKTETVYSSSIEDLKKSLNETIFRRIPIGAEATTVLVGSVDFLEQTTIAFVRLAQGIYLPQITEVPIPVRFMFILMGPKTTKLDYHEIGRSISTLMSNKQFHNIAYKADDRKALLSGINEFLDDSIVLPPGDWERETLLPFEELKAKSEMIRKRKMDALKSFQKDYDAYKVQLDKSDKKEPDNPFDKPLERTKRPFGGLINDIKRRYPFYISDFIDGLNIQCLAAAIFMFFAALSGAITFGGLMGDKTENMIGISETLVITALAGVIFGLFSGQPMVIIGTTGPLLMFDESLFQVCKSNNIDYLKFRIFIGIWLGILSLIVASIEGSVFIKKITRFTEDIFSALISLLYIYESVLKLIHVFHNHPILNDYSVRFNQQKTLTVISMNNSLNINEVDITPVNQPNTALFCTILALGTFAIAYYLRLFRNSKFLGRNARRMLGDFGVPIAIVTMVFLSNLVPQAYTDKLIVPDGLSPSNSELRGWIISPNGGNLSTWLMFAAAVPAMLVYILLFMETHISELIIDKKERKLKKGSGFHLDIVIICMINVLSGFFGAPWICAATVRSLAHVAALTVMSRTHAPGEKPHVVDVKEQRVSSLTVAILIGLSVLMAPLLRKVPMAILFGVFLYMGVSSTNGIQFLDRLKLFFMPIKHYPQTAYVRKVQTFKIHLFTLIQLLCFVLLWTIKSTKISLAFPFFLLLMIPIREQLKYVFNSDELRALDGDQLDVDDDEVDIYVKAPLPG